MKPSEECIHVSDYRLAEAELLEHYAARLRRGENGADFNGALVLVARVIERRI